MQNEREPESTQLNLATHQRIARGNYYEGVPDSIKLYLVSKPDSELDQEAIRNERLFFYRFCFDAPKAVREQIITLKQRYDFTDGEIRWLRYSGQLTIKRREAKLVPDRAMPIAGWVQVVLFSLVFGAGILQLAHVAEPGWKQMLGQLALGGVWMGSAWVLNRLYIAPWQALKRAGVTA